ncbi:hypothetical protein GUJ93_ZPchr0013g34321 [Zizania palustris]|uniref:Uncharacterized protein n=1 Tax=Zizania palustris TaxID=103762 RepID=A0A8J5WZ76_ZIZPA|nr:hypothetical protein GUJ93_ZPchr0013g34321 [Zizania palustris]
MSSMVLPNPVLDWEFIAVNGEPEPSDTKLSPAGISVELVLIFRNVHIALALLIFLEVEPFPGALLEQLVPSHFGRIGALTSMTTHRVLLLCTAPLPPLPDHVTLARWLRPRLGSDSTQSSSLASRPMGFTLSCPTNSLRPCDQAAQAQRGSSQGRPGGPTGPIGSCFFNSWEDVASPCYYVSVVCEPNDDDSTSLILSAWQARSRPCSSASPRLWTSS